jgi:predicted HTH transcriptional regulator
VVETPDRLVFSNLGRFIPPSVEWMLQHQSPPEHYRNQWLIEGMIRLRMIDQMGSGIRRMFETQRERFFPLPDYTIEGRSPTYHVSAKVAEWTSQKANYIRTRGLDDGYYQKMVREFLGKYEEATRQDIDNLLLRKLPEVLDGAQKANKIKNLLQAMRRAGIVIREGSRSQAVWKPGPNFNNDLG